MHRLMEPCRNSILGFSVALLAVFVSVHPLAAQQRGGDAIQLNPDLFDTRARITGDMADTGSANMPTPVQKIQPESQPSPPPSTSAATLREEAQYEVRSAFLPVAKPGRTDPSLQISEPEFTALREYHVRGQFDFAEIEFERLRSLYPQYDWTNDYRDYIDFGGAPGSSFDIELWELYNAEAFDALDVRIVELQRQEPGYQPPEELILLLTLREERQRLINASNAGQYATVISIDEQYRDYLLGCPNMDNMWRVAEAYYKSDRSADGFVIYDFILAQCPSIDDRVATLQKASLLVSPEELERLFATAERHAQSDEERKKIADVRVELERGQFAQMIGADGVVPRLDPEDVERFSRVTRERKDADGAAVLGWYYYRAKNYTRAKEWFELSQNWRENNPAAEGLVLTLHEIGQYEAAERTAHPRHDNTRGLLNAYNNLLLDMLAKPPPYEVNTAIIQRFAQHTMIDKYVEGAVGLGWYYYMRDEFEAAARWCETALKWKDDPQAVECLAVSYLQLGDESAYNDLRLRFVDVNQTYADIFARTMAGSSAAADAFMDGDYQACLELTKDVEAGDPNTAGLAMQRGWCLLALNRPTEAELYFKQAGMVEEARFLDPADPVFGQILSLLRRGLVSDAARMIEDSSLPAARRNELMAELLAQRAMFAFEVGDHEEALRLIGARSMLAPVRRDLVEVSAWSLFNLNRGSEAERLFEMLDRQYQDTSTREGLDLLNTGWWGYR